ncbi:hypothetical protein DAMA08_035630 [Martiniozyma asiatica (nom. inval.)]|nr:hypothetical protein DAMA08_035630 [Martiniozyma asiatica]
METFEIRSKSFSVKWVNLQAQTKVKWHIKPLKNSINFGIYRHVGDTISPPPTSSSTRSTTNSSLLDKWGIDEVHQVPQKLFGRSHTGSSTVSINKMETVTPSAPNRKRSESNASTNMSKLDEVLDENLVLANWIGRCNSDELQNGEFEAKNGGLYAFIFDNTFSKTKSKKVLFSHEEVIDNKTNSDLNGILDNGNIPSTPRQVQFDLPYNENVAKTSNVLNVNGVQILQGFLMKKKRRKNGKNFNKRYFSLNMKYGMLDYYFNEASQTIRGNMLISQTVISADSLELLMFLDSGMEQWVLKALNKDDFNLWVDAFNFVKRQNKQVEGVFPLSDSVPFDILSAELASREGRSWNISSYFDQMDSKLTMVKDYVEDLTEKAKEEEKNLNSFAPPTTRKSSLASSTNESSFGASLERRSSFFTKLKRRSSLLQSSSTNEPIITERNRVQDSFEEPPRSPVSIPSPRASTASSIPNIPELSLSNKSLVSGLIELRNYMDELEDQYSILKKQVNERYSMRSESRRTLTRTSTTNDSDISEFYDARSFFEETDNGVVMLNEDENTKTEPKINIFEKAAAQVSIVSSSDEENEEDNDVTTNLKDNHVFPVKEEEEEELNEEEKEKYTVLDLSPLPYDEPISYRKDIKTPTCEPPSMISIIRKAIGKDITSMTMPITCNEPISFLQKYCESFEYSNLINDAIESPIETGERILKISTFAMSFLAAYRDKVRSLRKPFNPLLNETFELIRPELGIRVITQKVIHKPFVMAAHAESRHWSIDHTLSPQQNFYGKTADVVMLGKLVLSLHDQGDLYEWSQPTTVMRNMVSFTGEKYTEPVDTMTIKSNTGFKCTVTFLPENSRFSSSRSEKVELKVVDEKTGKILKLSASGTWTNEIKLSTGKVLWRVSPLVNDHSNKYGFTQFTCSLNNIDEIHELCAPSDSRRRPDQKMYENGEVQKAETLKLQLEENQRKRRNDKAEQESLFFKRVGNDDLNWAYTKGENGYWGRRKDDKWDDVMKLW